MHPDDIPPAPLIERLAWFAGLWLAGLGTVVLLSYGIRLWIR